MTRRNLDQYFTPAAAVDELTLRVTIGGSVLECASGDNAIADRLRNNCASISVETNDVDPAMPSEWHLDATDPAFWLLSPAWVISNPPFNRAAEIVPQAFDCARIGVAFLLRLTILEPTEDRGKWLAAHPPDLMIVLPRMSFTDDNRTDNVTCAWFVWYKRQHDKRTQLRGIVVANNPRFDADRIVHRARTPVIYI